MALTMNRRVRETVLIGEDIKVSIINIDGRQVRLAIEAPREIKIRQGEDMPERERERRYP